MDDQVKTFLSLLSSLSSSSPFSSRGYAQKLLQATYFTDATKHFRARLAFPDVGQKDTSFDGENIHDKLNSLAIASAALGIGELENPAAFKETINTETATKEQMEHLAKALPFAYGDHINNFLRNKGHKTLQQLSADKEFVTSFRKHIVTPHFKLHESLKLELGQKTTDNISVAILFVNKYFDSGKPYTIGSQHGSEQEGLNHEFSSDVANPKTGAILHTWCQYANDDQNLSESVRQGYFTMLSASLSHTFAPDFDPSKKPCELAQAMFSNHKCCTSIIEATNATEEAQVKIEKETGSRNAFQTLGQELWSEWLLESKRLQEAVKQAAGDTVKTTRTPHFTGPFAPPSGGHWEIVSQGSEANDFLMAHKHLKLFNQGKVEGLLEKLTHSTWHGFGCFVPGTKVTTSTGFELIENLKIGSSVTTKMIGKTQESCVTNALKIPGNHVDLYGFNGQAPFFTANHVFVTREGLKAIDPVSARKQNPWAQIGEFKPDHQVLYSHDGSSLELVTVESFTQGTCQHATIHDLHFEDPGTQFFANGFLVAANMPVISPRRVAQSLRGLTRPQLAAALTKLPELHATIERFGSTTMLQSLQLQLCDPSLQPDLIDLKLVETSKAFLQNTLATASRSWVLERVGTALDTLERAELPVIRVHDNMLFLNDKYCERAQIKPTLLTWSRRVDDEAWEHGYCKFSRSLFDGAGALFTSTDPNSTTVNENTLRRFEATVKPLVSPVAPLSNHTYAISAESEETHLSGMKTESSTFVNNIQPTRVPEPVSRTWDVKEKLRVSYDKQVWDISQGDVEDKELQDPDYLFDLVLVDRRAEIGMKFHDYRIPQLDDLTDRILASGRKVLSEQPEHGPKAGSSYISPTELYRTMIEDVDGDITVRIRLMEPLVLMMASDAYEEGSKNYPNTNLTYKKLGSDFKLPFLFSDLAMKIRDFGVSPGALRELDSKAEDFGGARHALKGEFIDVEPLPQMPVNDLTSMELHERLSSSTISHLQPADVFFATKDARVANAPKSAYLLSQMTLDNAELARRAQDILYKAMLFHMDEKHRKNILNIENPPAIGNAPGDLPQAMAQHLDIGLATWLRVTYTPAYISLQISNFTQKQVNDWNADTKYTDADKRRIRYWWNGKSKECLSQCIEYRRLNELANAYASRQLLTGLEAYLEDGDKGQGGAQWAETLFQSLKATRILQKCIDNDGYFQRMSNILQALQPVGSSYSEKKEFAVQFAELVAQQAMLEHARDSKIKPGDMGYWKRRYDFLLDAIEKIILGLLQNDPAFQHLKGPFERMLADVEATQGKFVATQAAEQAVMLRQAVVQGLGDTILGFKSLYDKWQAAFPPGQVIVGGFWQRAQMIADQPIAEISPVEPVAGLKTKLVFVGGIIALAGAAYDLYNTITTFSHLSDEGKARCVLVTIRSCAQTAAMFPDIFRAGWVSFTDKPIPRLFRVSAAAAPAVYHEIELMELVNQPNAQAVQQALIQQEEEGRPWWKKIWGPKTFQALMLLISVALVVITLVQLFRSWGSYESGHWVLVAQVVVQVLQVIAETLTFAAVQGTLGVISAFAGPILALAGLVLLLVAAFVVTVKREPTEYEKWITSSGRSWLDRSPLPPKSQLSWSLHSISEPNGQSRVVSLAGQNISNEDVRLFKVSTNFLAGQTISCLFASSFTDKWTASSSPGKLDDHQICATISSSGAVLPTVIPDGPPQGFDVDKTFQQGWQVSVKGQTNNAQQIIIIPQGGNLSIQLKGTIGSAGKQGEGAEYRFIIDETGVSSDDSIGDTVQEQLTLMKA